MAYKDYSFLDICSLSEKEKEVWQMKNVILKSIGGLPDNVRTIRLAEMIHFKSEDKCTYGCFRPAEEDIIISRHLLLRPEAFLGVLCHELAHAKSEADDISKDFEDELTNMLGYVAYALVGLSGNNESVVSESRSLDTYTFAYAGCRCMECFEDRFTGCHERSCTGHELIEVLTEASSHDLSGVDSCILGVFSIDQYVTLIVGDDGH